MSCDYIFVKSINLSVLLSLESVYIYSCRELWGIELLNSSGNKFDKETLVGQYFLSLDFLAARVYQFNA